MTDLSKDKRPAGARKPIEKTRKGETSEVCEICGQKMEHDPDSGESFCPDCYYSEDKE